MAGSTPVAAERELERLAVRTLQAGIVAALLVGVAARNVGVAVNALVALGVTLLPGVLARDYRVHLGPRLTALLALAVFLHVVGMIGLYESVFWWDHLTHSLSALLVAAAGYATVRAFDRYSDDVYLPGAATTVFVLAVTLALGVLWEVLEFGARALAFAVGADPVLIQYGLDDTMLDLVFDAVGALAVALFGTRELGTLVATLTDYFEGAR